MTDQKTTEALIAGQRELQVINEAAKRIHTVLCNYAETLCRQQGEKGVVTKEDSMALLKGAVSGIAVLVARMALQRNPEAGNDPRPPEEYIADQLRVQFIDTFHEVARADAAAAIADGATVS